MRYDGAQGVTVREGTIDSQGHMTGQVNFLHDRHLSAIAPVAMVVNVAAPRIELTLNPYKMLGDVLKSLNDVSLFDQITAHSETANKVGTTLAKGEQWFGKRLEGQERVNKTAEALKTGSELMKDSIKVVRSDAAAYSQLVTTSASRASGASAILPCSHTDLAMAPTVAASAQAMGQKAGSTKTIFEQKLTRVDPPRARACQD